MSALIVHPSTRRPLPFPAEGYPHGLSLEAWPRNVALKRTQGQLWEREAERQVSGQDRPAYVIAVYNAAIKRDTERMRRGYILNPSLKLAQAINPQGDVGGGIIRAGVWA